MKKQSLKHAANRQMNGYACYKQVQRFLWYNVNALDVAEAQANALAAAAHFQRISAEHYKRARQLMGIED